LVSLPDTHESKVQYKQLKEKFLADPRTGTIYIINHFQKNVCSWEGREFEYVAQSLEKENTPRELVSDDHFAKLVAYAKWFIKACKA